MFSRIPFNRVNWITSSFLIGTFALFVTAVPLYLWKFGLDWFQFGMFLFLCVATAMSITLGYHRLFSHLTFKAHWSVRLFTLIFGAAAFENSALMWSSEHRRHHKHVDHEEDPYDISKGFFWAHIGWLLFKVNPQPPFDNVPDLKRDPLVMWQHKWVQPIALGVSFGLTGLLGFLWNGWSGALGGVLLGGVARIVCVQHSTFFINSACHMVGKRPFSSRCSARDSWVMALFTFGEGYHNYHHEFQHDYRNGVKPWHFDPTKWAIWVLHKLGLAGELRRVADEKIMLAELGETQRRLQEHIETAPAGSEHHGLLLAAELKLQQILDKIEALRSRGAEISREMLEEVRRDMRRLVSEIRGLEGRMAFA